MELLARQKFLGNLGGLARWGHFLVPKESNNFRAKLLHNHSLGFLICFFLIFQLILSSLLIIKPDVLGFAAQIAPERIIELTNQKRAEAGAPALVYNSALTEAALRKAGDMFAFNYWAHNSPSGRDPWTFFLEVGYRYLYAGENLARDFANPEAVVAAWMASPTHRDNIVNSKYKEIGVAVIDGTLNGIETTLVVQHFGTSVGAVAQVPAEKIIPQAEAKAPVEEAGEVFPEVVEEEVATTRVVLPPVVPAYAQATGGEKNLVSPFSLTQTTSLLLLLALFSLTLVDGLIVFKRRVIRLSGRPLAHTIFLLAMIIIILLSRQGAIL
jgi:hypothetical protein